MAPVRPIDESIRARAKKQGSDETPAPYSQRMLAMRPVEPLRVVEPAPPGGGIADDGLVARLFDEDSTAFELLYERHSARVLAVGLRILRDRDLAEEVMQDVFWQLWQRPEIYDPTRGRLIALLCRIARNRALDRIRAERSQTDRVQAAKTELDVHPPSERDSPLAILDNTRQGDRVRAALEDLEEPLREILVLGYFEGLTQSEIADRLGVPLGTVKTRTRRALERIRRALAAKGAA